MKNFSLVLLSVLGVAACGGDDGGSGGSGLSSSKQVKDLTQEEAIQLCHAMADLFPQREVTCSGQQPVEVGLDDADCTSGSGASVGDVPDECTATVGDAEACVKAFNMITDDQICMRTATIPPACAVIQSDACQSDDDGSAAAPRTVEEMRARVLRFIKARS